MTGDDATDHTPSDSGIRGISGTPPRLDDIPQRPEKPQSSAQSRLIANPLEDSSDLEKICSGTLADVIAFEKQLIRLSDDIDFIGMNMGIALGEVQDLLPGTCRIFYIGFTGRKGTGKSTATAMCARVCSKGHKIEGVTYSALASACSKGRIICLDEVDSNSEKVPELETILRQGIDMDAHYTKQVPDGKGGWIEHDIPIGGVKFINWRDPIDDALLQRTLVIKMSSGGVPARVIANNEAPGRFIGPLSTWFAAQAGQVRKNWTKEGVLALVEDRDNIITEKLDKLGGRVARHRQKAFWMLVVCELYGWDLEDTIRRLIDKQPEDDAFADYKEIVADVYNGLKDEKGRLMMTLTDFKKEVGDRVKEKGLYPLKSKGSTSWTGLRQECGFVEGLNEVKKSKRNGKRILVFDKNVLEAIGVESSEMGGGDEPEDGGS